MLKSLSILMLCLVFSGCASTPAVGPGTSADAAALPVLTVHAASTQQLATRQIAHRAAPDFVIYFDETPVLLPEHMNRASRTRTNTDAGILLTLTEAGREKLHAALGDVFEPAIVIMYEERVVYAPLIVNAPPLPGSLILVASDEGIPEPQIDQAVEEINRSIHARKQLAAASAEK